MKRAVRKAEVRNIVKEARDKGKKIALVPTMGYLHEGHLSLIKAAGAAGAFVVVSVFVNPIQFGPNEDYASYPRDLERDADLAARAGADLLFAPAVDEMYPAALTCSVEVGKIGTILCGASRPGHFNGAATVVSKLFNIVQPDRAYFGLKDYQQYLVMKRMVHDLDFPIEIIGVPIVREADGLALSSRNVFLTPEQRKEAVVLSRSLIQAGRRIKAGVRKSAELTAFIKAEIEKTSGVIDYIELRKADDLSECDEVSGAVVIAVAVRFGKTRLIDNIVVEG